MANETGAAFARDLGYLDKFFVNLTAHAATLPPAQGDRLKKLMAEETERWKEIRALIAGQAPAPMGSTTAKPSPAPTTTPVAPASAAEAIAAPKPVVRTGLTVGSLLGQPKK